MDKRVKLEIHRIVQTRALRPKRALEVGGLTGPNSLLRFPEFADTEKVCLNLAEKPDHNGIKTVTCNANDMHVFKDGEFDLVVSNAMLEHDKFFWKSIAEMKRVLAPGGFLILGVPGYDADPKKETGLSTPVFKFHFAVDYYRFSDMCVREVFFEGLEDVKVQSILTPPRIVGSGRKAS